MTVGFEKIPLLGIAPHYVENLEPGEAVGPFYLNFGLGENPRPGQQTWTPYWKTPRAGKYKLTHSVSIRVAGPKAKLDAASNDWKSGDLASGQIEFEIVDSVTTENKKEESPETSAVRERPSPLEFRVAVNPAEGDAGPRVPADFLKRHYPDNTPAGRAAAKDRGFIWIPVAKPRDGGVILPVEAARGDLRIALLGDTTDTTVLLDSERRIVKCEAVSDQNHADQQSIQVTLDEPAGAALRRLTEAHLNQKLAVVVEGKIIAAPTIRSAVGTDVMITGNFLHEEADKIVAAILSHNEPGDKPKPTREGGKTENEKENGSADVIQPIPPLKSAESCPNPMVAAFSGSS